MSARLLALLTCVVAATACGTDSSGGDDGPLGGSRTVTGTVVDFETGTTIAGAASISTSGVVPAPRVTTQGADFTIEGVPDNSTFQILAAVPPTHHSTFGPSVDVLTADISGVEVPVVSEDFLSGLATAFGVTPSATKGVLIAQLVDGAGQPKAGVPGGQIILPNSNGGPFFLDDNLSPDPNATSSSNSGYVVFFDVDPGIAELNPAAAPTVTLDMAASPINAGTVTLSTIAVTDGAPDTPTNVSFKTTIVPIFSNRGCVACHSGGGIGKDLGGLKLDGPASQVYTELRVEDPTRVRLDEPELSLVLTMPSREDPPDTHPNVTFASKSDPDYVKILVWIEEGGLDN